MSVPLQILLSVIDTMDSEPDDDTILEDPEKDNPRNVVEPPPHDDITDTATTDETNDSFEDNDNHNEYPDGPIIDVTDVGPQAIRVAHSIVQTCLSQLCK